MLENEQEILTVSKLNQLAKRLLEGNFPSILVEGELSRVTHHSSGHIYFAVKDANAQISCAMFRQANRFLNFKPDIGSQVLLRGRVSLYQARGDYQLIVESMEEMGDGALRKAFEQLKKKLFAEGLFDGKHKQDLFEIPQRLGLITSPTGAAIKDILSVLKRRFPSLEIIIYPCQVQGKLAAEQICHAIKLANKRKECDTLIVTRGGGSLEDLWCFNEESVARSIFTSKIPIISAIGHEIDYTIADFVADHRAPTPSAAAELVSPNQQELLGQFINLLKHLERYTHQHIKEKQQHLYHLSKRLKHPKQHIQEAMQRLDELTTRLQHTIQNQLLQKQMQLKQHASKLLQFSPQHHIKNAWLTNKNLQQRLQLAIKVLLKNQQQQLAKLTYNLDTLSPLATLSRGYAIAFTKDKKIIREKSDVKTGDKITVKLKKDEIDCQIV